MPGAMWIEPFAALPPYSWEVEMLAVKAHHTDQPSYERPASRARIPAGLWSDARGARMLSRSLCHHDGCHADNVSDTDIKYVLTRPSSVAPISPANGRCVCLDPTRSGLRS